MSRTELYVFAAVLFLAVVGVIGTRIMNGELKRYNRPGKDFLSVIARKEPGVGD